MNNNELIQLHVAMMYRYIFRDFEGIPVTDRVAYDIAQASHYLKRDLVQFVTEIGDEPDMDMSEWEHDDLIEFDEAMRSEIREIVTEAQMKEDRADILAATRDIATRF